MVSITYTNNYKNKIQLLSLKKLACFFVFLQLILCCIINFSMLLSLCVATFCRLLCFDEFSLRLILLLLFVSASGADIDDETLLPDYNNILMLHRIAIHCCCSNYSLFLLGCIFLLST